MSACGMSAIRRKAAVWVLCAAMGCVSVWVPMAASGAEPPVQVNPFPREVQVGRVLKEWMFDDGAQGWKPWARCEVAAADGALRIQCTGHDPYLGAACKLDGSHERVIVRMRMKSKGVGAGEFFWTTRRHPQTTAQFRQGFRIEHDGKWHEYQVTLPIRGRLTGLRLDPGGDKGTFEIDCLRIHAGGPHPLEIVAVQPSATKVRGWVRNHGKTPQTVRVHGQRRTIRPGELAEILWPATGKAAFEAVTVEVTPEDKTLPPLKRTTVIYRPEAKVKWVKLTGKAAVPEGIQAHGRDPQTGLQLIGPARMRLVETIALHVAPDGSGALMLHGGKLLAVVAPLVWRGGKIAPLRIVRNESQSLRLEGENDLSVSLQINYVELSVRIAGKDVVEGPVVRAVGSLQQGVLPGLEYLGKGERSSSTLDIETAAHLRFAPDPMTVTMPLMAFVTDKASVAMTWKDMSLQPTYATPNFFDGTADHRMSLRGTKIDATIRVTHQRRIEPAIEWAVKKLGGLPELPKPPRTRAQQWKLAMAALNGPISGKGGWGHCAEARWPRQPYADIASTIYRMTGQRPKLDKLVPGGAHVANDAIYFLTGRADRWLRVRGGQAANLIKGQRPDGSWRYAGKYRKGHFEDTASGHCARPAQTLLEHAYRTGDQAALAAGCKTLDYMKRFRTPRGAQVWELSLHTPDVLASAYLVWAYVRGYELTGKAEYLAEAHRWALSGLPFVYLWNKPDLPVMRYGTIPVFGATNWRAPLWIGLPVQWCGGVYAYALTKLAPHDKTFDWNKLARGILIAGEQMMYPDGPKVGCLPDFFYLRNQQRGGPSINPCAMASLRMALDGEVDSLAVATAEIGGKQRRVLAPFPVKIANGRAVIQAKKGQSYQVIVDGKRIVNVDSAGADEVPLD